MYLRCHRRRERRQPAEASTGHCGDQWGPAKKSFPEDAVGHQPKIRTERHEVRTPCEIQVCTSKDKFQLSGISLKIWDRGQARKETLVTSGLYGLHSCVMYLVAFVFSDACTVAWSWWN